jgi:small subunit ribosomal protein S17
MAEMTKGAGGGVNAGGGRTGSHGAQGAPARSARKVRVGLVVSDKMQKTVVVEVEDRVKHPLYAKVIRRTSKVKAHDENGSAGVGDRVLIMETRPLSATKRWRVVEILDKAK